MLYTVFTGWYDIKAYNICSIKSELNLAFCKCWFPVETSIVRMVCHGPLTDSQRKMRVRSVWGLLSSVCVCVFVGVCQCVRKGCCRVVLCLQIAPPHKASHNGQQALKLCRCLFFLQQQHAVPERLHTYPLSPCRSTNISAFLLLFLLYSAYLSGSSSFSLHISQGLPPSHFLRLKLKHTLSDYLQNTFFSLSFPTIPFLSAIHKFMHFKYPGSERLPCNIQRTWSTCPFQL